MNSSEPSNPKQENLSGFHNLILVIMLLMVFLVASRSPLDSDLWWHLQSGRVMSETGKPLITDVFSYTRNGQEWVNHSWLGEVALYGIYRVSGWTGLSAWMGLMAVLVAVLLWWQVSGSTYTRAAFILFTSVVCAPLWTPRPQFFSLLFLAFLTWLTARWLEKGGKIIWITAPLFILWSNLHGGYMLGILFLLACAIGLVMDAILYTGEDARHAFRQSGVLLLSAAGGYLAAAINPNGYRMWLIPFQTVGVGVLRQFIQEWSSPDFHSPETWPFAIFILLLVFCLSRKTGKTPFWMLIPSLLFLLMALYARRNLAAAAVVATPMLIEAWNSLPLKEFFTRMIPASIREWISRYRKIDQQQLSDNQKKWINLVFAGLMGLFCFFKLAGVTHPILMEAYEQKFYPAEAEKFMEMNKPINDGRLFNSYNWGGYLVWKNPQTKIFVDGRTDLFGDEILGEWMTVAQAGEGWQGMLEKWNVTRIILEPDRPIIAVLPSAGWEERYRDSQAVVFDRK
jgi:hypothetical protein